MDKDELINALILQRNKCMQRLFAHSVAVGIERSNIKATNAKIKELSELNDDNDNSVKEQQNLTIH